MAWDAERGVFRNDAAVASEQEVPTPLVIFGYGSLVFKPEVGRLADTKHHTVTLGQ